VVESDGEGADATTARAHCGISDGKRIAVAGVSRGPYSAANSVFRKLRNSGYEVFPVNPNASEVAGVKCYPDLASIPGDLDGLVIATHPASRSKSFGRPLTGTSGVSGSTAPLAKGASRRRQRRSARAGISCIVGGCPLMYCEPVDFAHRCMCAWLRWRGQVPAEPPAASARL